MPSSEPGVSRPRRPCGRAKVPSARCMYSARGKTRAESAAWRGPWRVPWRVPWPVPWRVPWQVPWRVPRRAPRRVPWRVARRVPGAGPVSAKVSPGRRAPGSESPPWAPTRGSGAEARGRGSLPKQARRAAKVSVNTPGSLKTPAAARRPPRPQPRGGRQTAAGRRGGAGARRAGPRGRGTYETPWGGPTRRRARDPRACMRGA